MADILIRGMEMPKNCEDCRLSYSDEYGTTICAACDDCAYSVSCPLVPIPEGHGRLIDADALERVCQEVADCDWNKKASPYSWEQAYQQFIDDEIAEAPTIIEAEGGEI